MASATVRIKLIGSQVLKDLEGVERGLGDIATAERKAAASTERSARKAAEAQKRAALDSSRVAIEAARRAEKEQTKSARNVAMSAKREADAQKREADRLTAYWHRAAQRSADMRIREEQRVTRQAAQEAARRARTDERTVAARQRSAERTLRGAGGFVGAGVAGALAGGVSAAGVARGVAGVEDIQTRVRRGNDFRETMIVLGGNVGMSQDQINRTQGKVLDTAMKFGKDPTEIVEGLAVGQERFNMLGALVENIDAITAAAKSSQGTVPEFVGMVGSLTSAFGLASNEIPKAIDIALGAARAGAINPADFAASFAASAGIFATNSKQRGIEGLRQFVGTSQGIGAGQFGAAESATRVERLMTDLSDAKVVQGLRERGINVFGADGKIDMGSLIEQIATSDTMQTSTQRQQVFKEVRALQGLDTLLAQRGKVQRNEIGAVDFASMAGIDAEKGAAGTARVLGMLESGGVLDMQRQAIEMQKHTIENLQSYNDQVIAITKATNTLEKSFGSLSLWASSIGIGGAVTGGTMLLGKLGGGAAGGAAAGAAGAGLLATLGTGVAAVGAGALAAGTLAAGAIGGAAGYGANALTENLTGKSISDRFADWLSSDLIAKRNEMFPGAIIDGKQSEVAMRVEVDVKDNRTHVKTSSKSKGANVSVGSGPMMPGAM
jgi:Phage-related minor tail protein